MEEAVEAVGAKNGIEAIVFMGDFSIQIDRFEWETFCFKVADIDICTMDIPAKVAQEL